MPLGSWFRRDKSRERHKSPSAMMSSKDKKERLAMKVMQAQTNPEKYYDLSDCGAVIIPDDTYTYCKLLMKTSLNLSDNCMTSLECGGSLADLSAIEILDISRNKIDNIPDAIGKLACLRIFKLSDNKIKTLPSTIDELSKLEEIYLSNNKLSKVPKNLCALPKLNTLDLDGNNIKVLPIELAKLQHSLCNLILNKDYIKEPSPDIIEAGTEAIIKHMCSLQGIEYEGLKESNLPSTPSDVPNTMPSQVDEAMLELFNKKREQQNAQMRMEDEMQMKEREQLANILASNTTNKEELLKELNQIPDEAIDYERYKYEKMKDHINMFENLNEEQSTQLAAYLGNTTHKESLKNDLLAQQRDLDHEIETLVSTHEIEHKRLLKDLTSAEEETTNALGELVNATSFRNTKDFMILLQDQERQMQNLLVNIAEESAELRQNDVVAAMQSALLEAAAAEGQRSNVEDQHNAWVNKLLIQNQLVDSHLEQVLADKMVDQDSWVNTLLQDEECQAAAFKILLMENDLKRSSILRQIGYIEYELLRLSSLEMRKKKCGLKYGSTTMLEQRTTLVGLLKSLLSEKEEREDQLGEYLESLKGNKEDQNSEDFWLVQYQRLLAVKPAGLAEAEENLDPKVRDFLEFTHSLDLLPIFARHNLTYDQLVEYDEDDFAPLGIGGATYYGIQRGLHQYLAKHKLEPANPSAPSEEMLEPTYGATAPPVDEEASAPPDEDQFIEAECVICLNEQCNVVFIPCGHVCVCRLCCSTLNLCPLCRAEISQKFLKSH